jgi:hypothetical protein
MELITLKSGVVSKEVLSEAFEIMKSIEVVLYTRSIAYQVFQGKFLYPGYRCRYREQECLQNFGLLDSNGVMPDSVRFIYKLMDLPLFVVMPN